MAASVNQESGQVSIKVANGAALRDVLRALDDRSVDLAEFALRRASLDEVFLALTGQRPENGTGENGTGENGPGENGSGRAGTGDQAATDPPAGRASAELKGSTR